MAGLAGRRDPGRLEQQVAHPVEQVDRRLGYQVERPHPRRDQHRGAAGARDRHALGRQLTDHHVQQRDDPKRERRCQAKAGDARAITQHRPHELLERRLANDAKPDAGQRDPELAGSQVRVDVLDGVARRSRPGPTRALHLDDLSQPQPRDGELRRYEEPIGRHQRQRDDQPDNHRRLPSPLLLDGSSSSSEFIAQHAQRRRRPRASDATERIDRMTPPHTSVDPGHPASLLGSAPYLGHVLERSDSAWRSARHALELGTGRKPRLSAQITSRIPTAISVPPRRAQLMQRPARAARRHPTACRPRARRVGRAGRTHSCREPGERGGDL